VGEFRGGARGTLAQATHRLRQVRHGWVPRHEAPERKYRAQPHHGHRCFKERPLAGNRREKLQNIKNVSREDLLGLVGLKPKNSLRSWLGGSGLVGIGLAVGAVVALLLTPKSGPEIRDSMLDGRTANARIRGVEDALRPAPARCWPAQLCHVLLAHYDKNNRTLRILSLHRICIHVVA
jgi:hypothetical protein